MVKPSTRTIQSEATDQLKALASGFLFKLCATDESRPGLAAAYQIALLEATRGNQMRVDPVVLAYVKVVVTMDPTTSELSLTLDVVKLQLRFFSAMTLDEAHDSLRPAEMVDTVMEYRYRIDRALDFVDRVITEERAGADISGTARA